LPARPINRLTPRYENIHAKDILVENARYFVKIIGIPESPLNNVIIENCELKCSNLFYAQDLKNSTFRNIKLTSPDSLLTLMDAKNIVFDHIEFNTPVDTVLFEIKGNASDSIFVKSCTNTEDIEFFAKEL